MGRLQGKRSVISGATGGMGLVACRRFCEEGSRVIGTDLDEAKGKELEAELTGEGFDFAFQAGDVTSTDDVLALADLARERLGGVDVLYNNAGIILGKPLAETTLEDWDRLHDVNLKAIFITTKAFLPLVGKGGSIINVSSVGGDVAFYGMSAYSAAKAGVIGFSKGAAADLAPDIRVNALLPGTIDTPMPQNFIKDMPDKDEVWEHLQSGHLVGRAGYPEEIVSAALFLASDEASFVTGSAMMVDGGWSTM
ncbi:MAG TPA: SDR family NAD(P)-dependent oxidoreductase [Solirubrobacterales bacterium]